MYPFFIPISLGLLVSTVLLYKISVYSLKTSEVSRPGSDFVELRQWVTGKPMVKPEGGYNVSESSGCQLLFEGFGPLPEDDTPEAFRDFLELQDFAIESAEPNGYSLAVENADGAIEVDVGYLGLEFLREYNAAQCAKLCDDRPLCGSFNIYFERDPLYDPNEKLGCPNPISTNNIKCVLWQSPLTNEAVINHGETRVDFEVVIAGSNLYNKKDGVLRVPGFVGPRDGDNNAAFDVPLEPMGGYDTLISRDVFEYNSSFSSYDAALCASICSQWTQRNSEAPKSDRGPFLDGAFAVCTMFVAFELRKGDEPVAMVCDSYSSVWSSHYQTLRGVEDLLVIKVSIFQRDDYGYLPICAMDEHCKGDEYYPGGDCSGWGRGKCQEAPPEYGDGDSQYEGQ